MLVVATPTASAGLDTKRIALIRSPVAIDYFADGEWIDRPPFLVKEALIEGFQKSGAFAGVGSEGLGLNADYVLNTDIRDFTAIYDTPDGPPLARVRIAAELITMPGRNIAAATSMTREARAGATELPSIVLAFDRALGEAVQELIAWSASNPALPKPDNGDSEGCLPLAHRGTGRSTSPIRGRNPIVRSGNPVSSLFARRVGLRQTLLRTLNFPKKISRLSDRSRKQSELNAPYPLTTYYQKPGARRSAK